uniref:Centriolar coiled-coil protein 110 n=1 Tax=Oryzias latipes TaxID=8090 RepID=A0A3P9HK68_ORYLA
MRGRADMESYEEFCLRSLVLLQEEGKLRKKCEPFLSLKAQSAICFYGRAVLSPLLSVQQRSEMCGYKQKAVQLERDRQNQQRNKLPAQNILDQTQVQKVSSKWEDKAPVFQSPKTGGYTLVTDSPGLLRDPGCGLQVKEPATLCSETSTLNGYRTEEDVTAEKSDDEGDDDEDISLDSLLKRSREYVKKEQQGSKADRTVSKTPSLEAASRKEEKSPVKDTGVEFGFSLHHSPIGLPPIHHQALYDPSSQKSVSPSKSEHNASPPSLEPSILSFSNRRKPRPLSTGNIHISFPISPTDLIPRSPGRSEEASSAAFPSTVQCCLMKKDGVNHRSTHCDTSPELENRRPVNTTVPTSVLHHDLTAGFRRRCHTLDSQMNSYQTLAGHMDRSQERVPRFMAGVVRLPPTRHTPTATSELSYEVDSTFSSLPRPHTTPDSVSFRLKSDHSQEPNSGMKASTVLRNSTANTEDSQWRAQALENIQRRLNEEHGLKMSPLLAEQEKEQQCPHLVSSCNHKELEERRPKKQGFVQPLSEDPCGWNCRCVNSSCPAISPSCPGLSPVRTPSELSPGHSLGFHNPSVTFPSVQLPVYLWGSTRGANKSRARLSLVLTAEQQRAFCRICAIVRGFLVRRLLKTEKVKHLRQTIVDTQEFIRSFQNEAEQKKSTYSEQDVSLQERVRAQLRAALYDIHDIFFEMSLMDRLTLLQQERELRAERKLRDLEKAKSTKERLSLSAATQRSLDRKKRVGESPAQARKVPPKQKSPTANRVQKTSQGQNCSGQSNRQGSWYRKTPEERVRRSDSLKKQHSLG